MQINYIILAHHCPQGLARLVNRLRIPSARFYIHIDKQVKLNQFTEIFLEQDDVFFISDDKRIRTQWGSIGIVKATLVTLKQAVLHAKSQSYFVLLSGQDYPIKSNKFIFSFFTKNNGINFISGGTGCWKRWDKQEPKMRINRYNFHFKNKEMFGFYSLWEKKFYSTKSLKNLIKVMKLGSWRKIYLLLIKRQFPKALTPYGGGQWWALPKQSISKVLNFIDEHPNYLKYHEYTHVPDEIFFHSIIYTKIPSNQIGEKITHVNWSKKGCKLPVVFSEEDFKELQTSSCLFARKFDHNSPLILDLIDSELLT